MIAMSAVDLSVVYCLGNFSMNSSESSCVNSYHIRSNIIIINKELRVNL